jgi:hypothetical protein
MYKTLLSGAVTAAAIFGLSQPMLAEKTPNQTMPQNEVSQTNVESGQANTVKVKGVVLEIFGESYRGVITGHDALMGTGKAGTNHLVRIRTEDGREQTFIIEPEAQAAAGIAEGSDVELTLYSGQLVAVSGPSGNYQIAEVRVVETDIAASTAKTSESMVTESTTSAQITTIAEEPPVAQPVPQPAAPIPALW